MTRLFNGGRGGEGLHMIKLELFRNPYFFNNLARSFFLLCLRSCLLKLSFLHNPVLPVTRKKRTVNSIRFQWIKICRSRLWIIKHWSSALSDHIRSMKQKEVTEKTQKNTARREHLAFIIRDESFSSLFQHLCKGHHKSVIIISI